MTSDREATVVSQSHESNDDPTTQQQHNNWKRLTLFGTTYTRFVWQELLWWTRENAEWLAVVILVDAAS
jgi:hypothetical protein